MTSSIVVSSGAGTAVVRGFSVSTGPEIGSEFCGPAVHAASEAMRRTEAARAVIAVFNGDRSSDDP